MGSSSLSSRPSIYAPCYVALLLVAKRLDQTEIEFGRRIIDNIVAPIAATPAGTPDPRLDMSIAARRHVLIVHYHFPPSGELACNAF